jgi:import inner membrane translocase subunit TIM23
MIRRSSTTTSTHYLIPTWNDYFQLRSKRRQFEVLSYVPSTILPTAITGSYFMAMQIDPTSTIFGMDPLMAAGLATAGSVSTKKSPLKVFFFFR